MMKIINRLIESTANFVFSEKRVRAHFDSYASNDLRGLLIKIEREINLMDVNNEHTVEDVKFFKTSANIALHECALSLKTEQNVKAIKYFEEFLSCKLRSVAFNERLSNIKSGGYEWEEVPVVNNIIRRMSSDFENCLLKKNIKFEISKQLKQNAL